MENNNSIYIDIFKEIRLKSEAQKLSEQIDAYLISLFQIKDKSNKDSLREIFGERLADIIIKSLKDVSQSEITNSQLQFYLSSLNKVLNEAKTAELTLSIEADDDLILSISSKLREKLSLPTLLIDIKLNKDILGGAEIILNGKYVNLSLDKYIEDMFKDTNIQKNI